MVDSPLSNAGPNAPHNPTLERPLEPLARDARYGSDVAADTLRALDIAYVTLTPGASFRGLHDSLVNRLGNQRPAMLLCLHEEHAVAIAHGWAKVTGKAMAAAVHSNVGLMHATMALFNAWCDRMPLLLIGATGPVDSEKRRPWIDWIHTARDQGSLVRGYVKWDDQPASPGAAREALIRAKWMAETAPRGPVYVNLDAGMQEAELETPLQPLDIARLVPAVNSAADSDLLNRAATLLAEAKQPVVLAGRGSRTRESWDKRVALAERIGARVISDLKLGAVFPTDHPLHAGMPATWLDAEAGAVLRAADVILSLDWVDLGGTLKAAFTTACPPAKVLHASLDHRLHGGWSMDYQSLPPVDLQLAAESDAVVGALLDALQTRPLKGRGEPRPFPIDPVPSGRLKIAQLAHGLRRATEGRPVSLLHLPLSWQGSLWPFRHPLDFIGQDGGGGIGAGPGISVGAALALRGSGRLPIGICGDGDFLMGATAVWTAAHYRIPLLIVVANNRSFYNDEVHQERMARLRGRPVENKWIGQRIADPDIDIAALARAQGAQGFGPVAGGEDLIATFAAAIAVVEAGGVAVVDVRIEPGYTSEVSAAVVRSAVGKGGA
jgi:thiamine pyrophosphate-dependent acetolactate synthase large subunit-like protein